MAEWESKITLLFKEIDEEFAKYDKITDDKRAEAKLSLLTSMIRDSKQLIKSFEREARVDGRPTQEILATKQRFVNQVNSYVARKKQAAAELKDRAPQAASQPATSSGAAQQYPAQPDQQPLVQKQVQEMTNQEIIQHGRQRMDDIDSELEKGKRIVVETEDVAVKTAAQLKNQTDQMGRVVNDLNEIEFSMQRASKVIKDITRGLATDKCIMCLVFLVAAGIVAAIAMKLLGVGDEVVNLPGPEDGDDDSGETETTNTARKLLAVLSSVN